MRTSDGDGDEEALKQALRRAHVFQLDLASQHVQPVTRLGRIPALGLHGAISIQMSKYLVAVGTRKETRVYDRQTGKLVWSIAESSNLLYSRRDDKVRV